MPNVVNTTVDSIIDEATTHELYVWPFAEAVRAGSGSFMCACASSYPLLNGFELHELTDPALPLTADQQGPFTSTA